jgi:zinc-ribbon domain
MIVCKKCGNENRDQDSFCSSCGAFLEWSGEKVAEPQKQPQPQSPQPPPTAPPPPDERQGLVKRVKKAVGIEES